MSRISLLHLIKFYHQNLKKHIDHNLIIVVCILTFIAIVFIFNALNKIGLFDHLKPFNPGYRISNIVACDKAYEQTHQFLIKIAQVSDGNGNVKSLLMPIENTGDDVGSYFYLIYFKNVLKLSSVRKIYHYFFSFIIILSYIISVIGMRLIIKNSFILLISSIGISIFTFFCFFVMDVYVMGIFVAAFIPLSLYLFEKFTHFHFSIHIIYMIILGFLIGFAKAGWVETLM